MRPLLVVKISSKRADKKIENSQGGVGKPIVFGQAERGGNVKLEVVENRKAKTLIPKIKKSVREGSLIMTDELASYKALYKEKYLHSFINHSAKEYVSGNVHTNNIENVWSLLKRGLLGIYHFTSDKHLQKYLDEFAFRYNYHVYDKK